MLLSHFCVWVSWSLKTLHMLRIFHWNREASGSLTLQTHGVTLTVLLAWFGLVCRILKIKLLTVLQLTANNKCIKMTTKKLNLEPKKRNQSNRRKYIRNSFLFFSGNGAAVAVAATSIATQWYLLRQDHTALNSTGRNYRTMEFSIRHSRHTFKHVETYHFITIDKENVTEREREWKKIE